MPREKFSPHDRSLSPQSTYISADSNSFRPSIQSEDPSVVQTVSASSREALPHAGEGNNDTDLTLAASYFNQLLQQSSKSENDRSSQMEESTCVAASSDDDLLDRKHVTPPIQPMETNVEGNVHKLRLRLIDSESKKQRARSHEPSKHPPHKSKENTRPAHSRSVQDVDIQQIQDLYGNRHRASQQMVLPSYSFDSRLYLPPLNEDALFESSNMDDLIDSMARRRLAYRLLNPNFDLRRGNRYYVPYFQRMNGGQILVRNDDPLSTHRSSFSQTDHDSQRAKAYDQMVRSRVNHHELDPFDTGMSSSSREDTGVKLPPISAGHHSKPPRSQATKSDPRTSQQTLPFVSSEHLIKLPSDIYVSPKAEHSTRKARRRRRRRSTSEDTRSESDQSDEETDVSTDHRHEKHSKNSDPAFFTEPHPHQKKKTKVRRNLFKKAAVGILFTVTVKRRAVQHRVHRSIQSPTEAIHRIRLQELLVAVHRVYLEPDGPIFNALIQAVSHPVSLQHALNSSSSHCNEAIETIANAMRNVISKVIQFMPKDGVLGTTKTSAISVFLQNGNPFPESYFWQCERERLEFDQLKLINISKQRAVILFIGLFIFRALVTTLLIKPVKYRLILGQLTASQSASLKILASVMLYLGRRTASPKGEMLALPQEWRLSLHTDVELAPILQHSDIKSILSSCEHSLRLWCEEYIRRIDECAGKDPRN